MADQTPEQERYRSDVTKLADQQAEDFEKTARKVEPHQGQNKVTTSTDGTVETTTHEKKA